MAARARCRDPAVGRGTASPAVDSDPVNATRHTSPVQLLWGEDDFLLREAAFQVLGDLRPTEVDAASGGAARCQDLATPSLFGERRALLITDARSLSKEAMAELVAYLSAPDPDSPLVICCRTAERGKPPVALERAVKPVGDVRELEAREEGPRAVADPARAWTTDRPGAPGGSLARGDAGGGPRRAGQALEQLASAFAGQRITPAAGRPRSSGASASRRSGTSATGRSARTCRGRSAPCGRSRRAATSR